ncbi:hypothetical protein NKI38_01680 [Mesorhizobium sp. M0621]
MALDHARAGIRVNSVSPGSIHTPILEKSARGENVTDADVEVPQAIFKANEIDEIIGTPAD